MDLAEDLRLMLTDLGEPVTLPNGNAISGVPGLASSEDQLVGDTIVANKTRTLRVATADIPGVVSGVLVAWNAKSYRVVHLSTLGLGAYTKLFLGAP